jgi:hypothetical protein
MADARVPEKKGRILIKLVRAFIRDDAVLNELLEGKESSDGQVKQAIIDAIDDWNTTPPLLAPVTVATHPSERLLVRGAAIELLMSAGIFYGRNNLNYSDGGITVADKDKGPIFQSFAQQLIADYERKKQQLKISQNIGMGYGQVPSEYSAYAENDEHF